jgi:hypothetical protein
VCCYYGTLLCVVTAHCCVLLRHTVVCCCYGTLLCVVIVTAHCCVLLLRHTAVCCYCYGALLCVVIVTAHGGGNPRMCDSGWLCDGFLKKPLLTVSRSFMNVANRVLWRMAIILKANNVNLFVFSVLCVFWYHSPNVLNTPHICDISWLRVTVCTANRVAQLVTSTNGRYLYRAALFLPLLGHHQGDIRIFRK